MWFPISMPFHKRPIQKSFPIWADPSSSCRANSLTNGSARAGKGTSETERIAGSLGMNDVVAHQHAIEQAPDPEILPIWADPPEARAEQTADRVARHEREYDPRDGTDRGILGTNDVPGSEHLMAV